MNLNNIFGEIEKVDADVYNRLDSRRKALKNFANFGSKIAMAAVPMALGSLFKKHTPAITAQKTPLLKS